MSMFTRAKSVIGAESTCVHASGSSIVIGCLIVVDERRARNG